MSSKNITQEYVDDLCKRIEQGEVPPKNTALSTKEFVATMLPHVKNFLAKGFSYEEISAFIGHVSPEKLKKALAKELTVQPKKVGEPRSDAKTGKAEYKQIPDTGKPEQQLDKKEPTKPSATKTPVKGDSGKKN